MPERKFISDVLSNKIKTVQPGQDMVNSFERKKIEAFAAEVYKDLALRSPEEELANFLDKCSDYNLTVFVSSFVCHDLFGHSHPERLLGDDIELFMKHADPFLQTAMLQRSLLS